MRARCNAPPLSVSRTRCASVWVKTNQLQRIIRTGRTGHWLNHSKEHCLIGAKGAGGWGANIDCDVIVAEVRETSRKPDEVYGILERLSPGTRKLEIFGRGHNTRPGAFPRERAVLWRCPSLARR